MRLIIYESSSVGGCYEYARTVIDRYIDSGFFDESTLIVPDTPGESPGKKLLCNDRRQFKHRWLSRIYFIFRSFINPLILFFHLLTRKKSFVLLNDFEQLSFIMWVPMFYLLKWKHRFGIFLHDPERDSYLKFRWLSVWSMKWIISLQDIILYHEVIPVKPYYKPDHRYLSVPHGIYPPCNPDPVMNKALERNKENKVYLSILGNIRWEKNYEMAVRSLATIPEAILIIAGNPSSSNITLENLKELANELGVNNRIHWFTRYLSNEEMAAVIESSDLILLNYASTFHSQSGILNLVAPYRKKVLISKTSSGLYYLANRFNIGYVIEPNDQSELDAGIKNALRSEESSNWEDYLDYASWERQIQLIADKLKIK